MALPCMRFNPDLQLQHVGMGMGAFVSGIALHFTLLRLPSHARPAQNTLLPSRCRAVRRRRVRPVLPGQKDIVTYPLEGLLAVTPPDRRYQVGGALGL